MSIWGSGADIGEDDYRRDGSVLNYIRGWSNHYPTDKAGMAGRRETSASVSTASVPPWCVPGHRDTNLDNDQAAGRWLRLDMVHNDVSVYDGFTVGDEQLASVVMREDAVRKLRDELDAWLAIPKLDGAS